MQKDLTHYITMVLATVVESSKCSERLMQMILKAMAHHVYDLVVHTDKPDEWADHLLCSLTTHWLHSLADT